MYRLNYRFASLLVLSLSGEAVHAQLTLAADDPPADPPWKQPATFAYVRNGDGTSNATADVVLRYRYRTFGSSAILATQTDYGIGTYIHRDTTDKAPRNDRGVQASISQLLVSENSDNGGPVWSLNLQGKVSIGKTLEKFNDATGVEQQTDRTKDRQTLMLGGYLQPSHGLLRPPPPGTRGRPEYFFDSIAGFYSDHSHGGSGVGIGRLTGVMASLGANIAPLGLEPRGNSMGHLGMVPIFRASAQRQHDTAGSGERDKGNRTLYVLEANIAFAPLSDSYQSVVPTLTLRRSIGADILIGRPESSKTELALGLSF